MKRLAWVAVLMLGTIHCLSGLASAQRGYSPYRGYGYGYSRFYPGYHYGGLYNYGYDSYRYNEQRYSTQYSPYLNNYPRYGSSWGTFPGYPWYRSPTQRFEHRY